MTFKDRRTSVLLRLIADIVRVDCFDDRTSRPIVEKSRPEVFSSGALAVIEVQECTYGYVFSDAKRGERHCLKQLFQRGVNLHWGLSKFTPPGK